MLGNAVKNLEEPNLVASLRRLILGLTLGSIPVKHPGISLPVKLGLAGGPIIVGILIGTFDAPSRDYYHVQRQPDVRTGPVVYLSHAWGSRRARFFETVMRPEGTMAAAGIPADVRPRSAGYLRCASCASTSDRSQACCAAAWPTRWH